jgi:hypothetical protein
MPTKATKPLKSTATKSKLETNGPVAPEVMTLAEAAMWLRVSEEGLKADAVAGRIPARQVAGEWRFNKAVLLVWFAESEKRPKTGAELVARLREINPGPTYAEDPEEAEAFIAELYKLRKTMWSVG